MKSDIPKNLFKKYAGMRVALVDGKVVAATHDAYVSYQMAKKKYPNKKIGIFAVPRKEDKYLLI